MTRPDTTKPIDRNLLAEARTLARRSNAPGAERAAALAITADGERFPGVAIHLGAAAGLSACAEQVAICAARAASSAPIVTVVLWIPAAAGTHPCGRCLQTWLELARDARFVLQRGEAEPQDLDLLELLPDAFEDFRSSPGA